MRLYIGNATKQHHDFAYVVPENKKLRMQTIRPGGQIAITGDLSTPEVDAIVEQHRKYGMVNVDAIDRTKKFTGLCYSTNGPISVDKLSRAMQRNTDALVEQGREIRKNAAVAESNRLEGNLQETGRNERLRGFETSIVEENPDATSGTAPISEGVQVARGDDDPAPRAKKSHKRK